MYICTVMMCCVGCTGNSSSAVVTVYHTWMEKHGGSIVNIIIDMWRGFPGMAYVTKMLMSLLYIQLYCEQFTAELCLTSCNHLFSKALSVSLGRRKVKCFCEY